MSRKYFVLALSTTKAEYIESTHVSKDVVVCNNYA